MGSIDLFELKNTTTTTIAKNTTHTLNLGNTNCSTHTHVHDHYFGTCTGNGWPLFNFRQKALRPWQPNGRPTTTTSHSKQTYSLYSSAQPIHIHITRPPSGFGMSDCVVPITFPFDDRSTFEVLATSDNNLITPLTWGSTITQ